ncbi:hypothetical protein K525DRAFT_253169 [Schizophyllum commune Loenen D]|nr:hypothetical protein K525DRAFT_253169 [Schizophyllum commune Loenen D]
MGPQPSKATAKKSRAKPAPTQEHQTADSSDKGRKARTASSKVPGAGKKAGGPPKAAAAIDESPSSSGDEGEDGEVPTAAPKSSGMSRKATKALRPSKQALRESNGASDSDDEDVGASDDSIEEASSDDNLASLREKLARTVALARKLKQKKQSTGPANTTRKSLDRVPGSGTSIQLAMGLIGGPESKNYHTYKAVQRGVKDLCIRGQIPWQKTWGKVPPEDKAKLCRAAREDIPFLARYRDDWATLDLAHQWCKNQRNRAYADGTLERPKEYAYLKANAAQRTEYGSRRKRAFIEAELAGEAAGAEPERRKRHKVSTSARDPVEGTSALRKSNRKKGKGEQSSAEAAPYGPDSGDVDEM